ncbi:MAG: hypothetical protein AB1611_16200 [bacterium]
MRRWYLLLNAVFAIWVLADGFKRKANAALWAVGTLVFGSYIFPVYLITRQPSKTEALPKGRPVWRFLKNFAFFSGIVCWTLLLIMAGVWKDTSTVNAKEESPEYKLAVLNAEGYVCHDDETVYRFSSLLDQLSSNYGESRQHIANISVIAYKKVRTRDRKDASLLNIMEGLNKLCYYGDLKDQKYAAHASIYVRLRCMGQSHKQAIKGLQALVRGY